MENLTEQKINILRKDVEAQMQVLYKEVAETLARFATKVAEDVEALEKRLAELEGNKPPARGAKDEGKEL